MGSTFGKVRKYNLTPVDDSAVPLKYNSVTEDQTVHSAVPLTNPGLKDNATFHPAPSKSPPIKDNAEQFQETTPNYGQYFPDHLRYTVDGMYIPRTKSQVGHHFSTKSLERTDSSMSLNGPPLPLRHSKTDTHINSTPNIQPRHKYYSAEYIDKLLTQIRSDYKSKSTINRSSQKSSQPPQSQRVEPCKYCTEYNSWIYRDHYLVDPDPPPYRPISSVEHPRYPEHRLPFTYTPSGKHYHILEVNPQPYFTDDRHRPLHLQGGYNVWEDTARPNVMEPDTSHEESQNSREHIKQQVVDRELNKKALNDNHTLALHQNLQQRENSSTSRQQRSSQYRHAEFEQTIQNDFKTRSLPSRGGHTKQHHCYTIPEENVTWPPPFHHTRSYEVNRGGFRK